MNWLAGFFLLVTSFFGRDESMVSYLPDVLANVRNTAYSVTAQLPIAETQSGPRVVGTAAVPVAPLSARAYLIEDMPSGRILAAHDDRRVFPIASLTKLATALVVLEQNPKLKGEVTIEASDIPRDGKAVFSVGDRVKIADAFAAMMIASANDAARALARSTKLSSTSFITRMHTVARRVGASSVQFVEPTGLDPKNRATAAAIAELAHATFLHPTIAPLLRERERAIELKDDVVRVARTTNVLLADQGDTSSYRVVAGKTGYIEESGFNFIVLLAHEKAQVLVVVLGATDHLARFSETESLAQWAFRHYTWSHVGG